MESRSEDLEKKIRACVTQKTMHLVQSDTNMKIVFTCKNAINELMTSCDVPFLPSDEDLTVLIDDTVTEEGLDHNKFVEQFVMLLLHGLTPEQKLSRPLCYANCSEPMC
jgi:hypothetical protein